MVENDLLPYRIVNQIHASQNHEKPHEKVNTCGTVPDECNLMYIIKSLRKFFPTVEMAFSILQKDLNKRTLTTIINLMQ